MKKFPKPMTSGKIANCATISGKSIVKCEFYFKDDVNAWLKDAGGAGNKDE